MITLDPIIREVIEDFDTLHGKIQTRRKTHRKRVDNVKWL